MQIIVQRPFSLRSGAGPVREFPPGRHSLTEEEAAHPYLRAVVADGLASVVVVEGDKPPPSDPPPSDPPPSDAPPSDAPPSDAPPSDAPSSDAPPEDPPPPARSTPRKK